MYMGLHTADYQTGWNSFQDGIHLSPARRQPQVYGCRRLLSQTQNHATLALPATSLKVCTYPSQAQACWKTKGVLLIGTTIKCSGVPVMLLPLLILTFSIGATLCHGSKSASLELATGYNWGLDVSLLLTRYISVPETQL